MEALGKDLLGEILKYCLQKELLNLRLTSKSLIYKINPYCTFILTIEGSLKSVQVIFWQTKLTLLGVQSYFYKIVCTNYNPNSTPFIFL